MELNTVHKKFKKKKKKRKKELNTHLLGGKTIVHYDLVHKEYQIISHDLNFFLISFSRIDMFKIIIDLFSSFFLIQIQSFYSSWLLNTLEYISNGADNLYMTK